MPLPASSRPHTSRLPAMTKAAASRSCGHRGAGLAAGPIGQIERHGAGHAVAAGRLGRGLQHQPALPAGGGPAKLLAGVELQPQRLRPLGAERRAAPECLPWPRMMSRFGVRTPSPGAPCRSRMVAPSRGPDRHAAALLRCRTAAAAGPGSAMLEARSIERRAGDQWLLQTAEPRHRRRRAHRPVRPLGRGQDGAAARPGPAGPAGRRRDPPRRPADRARRGPRLPLPGRLSAPDPGAGRRHGGGQSAAAVLAGRPPPPAASTERSPSTCCAGWARTSGFLARRRRRAVGRRGADRGARAAAPADARDPAARRADGGARPGIRRAGAAAAARLAAGRRRRPRLSLGDARRGAGRPGRRALSAARGRPARRQRPEECRHERRLSRAVVSAGRARRRCSS